MTQTNRALAFMLLGLVGVAHGVSLDNTGTEFILGFMPTLIFTTNPPPIELLLSSETSTSVDIEYPIGTLVETVEISPGTVEVVTIPTQAAQGWTANEVGSNLIRATAANAFAVTLVNTQLFTSDAALGLPVDTMNTEYIVVDYNPVVISSFSYFSQFLVYAAFDDTEVTITPAADLVGNPAGTPFKVALNRGEAYFAKSATASVDNSLTGSLISSNRPVGMANGNECTQVVSGCDHLFEVAQPVQTWGKEIGVANLPQRPGGSVYRVVASQDDTEVTLDDGPLVTLANAGDFFETDIIAGNHVFRGDKPIFVAQYMTGGSAPNADEGDPAQGNMIPFEQYLNEYTFSTVGGDQFTNDYATIIAENTDIANNEILLNGSPLDPAIFQSIPTTTYSSAVVELTDGTTYTTLSTNPHGVTVQGYDFLISYLYPAGAQLQFINPINDVLPPIVTIDENGMGVASDNRQFDSGIFFIELGDDSVNLELTVDPFVPADGVVGFMVTLIDDSLVTGSGSVVVTDGSGNVSVLQLTFTPGLCCEASGGSGCCNVDCAEKVCDVDSSCCGVNGWTEECAAKARSLCGNLCRFSGDNCCPTCPLSPCVDGATGPDLYHPHCSADDKFIQCSAWGRCYEQDCGPGTVWNEAISTCVHGR